MTLRDSFLVIDGYLFQAEAEYTRSVQSAWLTAALARQKRLPSLGSLLNKSKLIERTAKPHAERDAEARKIAAEIAPGLSIMEDSDG
ncbi:MAG: hypothetical protein V3R83_09880 [Gammaproteobacteria bacterium]